MWIYFILIVSVLILAGIAEQNDYIYDNTLSSGKIVHSVATKRSFVVLVLLLIFISAFRYYVGADYNSYYVNFPRYVEEFGESIYTLNEPGYRFFCWIGQKITNDHAIGLIIASIFSVGISFATIYKNTNRLLVATLLFIFLECWHGSFNAVRQGCAVAIVFAALPYLRDKKFFKYAILVFIAFLFHRSAILMIIPYFLVHRKITPMNIILVGISVFVVLSLYDSIFSMTSVIMQETYDAGNEYIWRSINPLRVAVGVLPALYYLVLYWNAEKDEMCTFYLNIVILYAALVLIASGSAYLSRYSMYLAPFQAIAMTELNKNESKSSRIIEVIMIILFFAFWIYQIATSWALNDFRWLWQR